MTAPLTLIPSVRKTNAASPAPSNGSNRESGPIKDNRGVEDLLKDPSFRLVKVVRNDREIGDGQYEIESLTIVTPATDIDIAKDVEKKGWFCVSHLWGHPDTWIDWDGPDVIDVTTGEVIIPKVHPGKSEAFTKLLQSPWDATPYWWIDVFCARSDTPLVIMGDIYKYSRSCSVLIDSSLQGLTGVAYSAFSVATELTGYHIEEAVQEYLDIVSKRTTAEGGEDAAYGGWAQTLRDAMHWSLNHYGEVVFDDLRYLDGRDPSVRPLLEALKGQSLEEQEDVALDFMDELGEYHVLEWLSTCRVDTLKKSVDDIANFFDCQWMSRVWTLQELALPAYVILEPPLVKQGDIVEANVYEVDFHVFQKDLSNILKVLAKAYEVRRELAAVRTPGSLEPDELSQLQTPAQLLALYQSIDPVLAHIYNDYRRLFEVIMAIGRTSLSRPDIDDAKRNKRLKLYLNSLATSKRRVLYPVDFVYGVLGILNIDIPRMEDPKEVWQLFCDKIQERHPDIHVPRNVNLSKATKMEDVFGDFGFTHEESLSSDAVMHYATTF